MNIEASVLVLNAVRYIAVRESDIRPCPGLTHLTRESVGYYPLLQLLGHDTSKA